MTQQLRSTTLLIIDNDGEQEEHLIINNGQQIEIDGQLLTIKTINEFDEEEKEIYNNWKDHPNEKTGLLKASLYYFPYGDNIEGDGPMMELMDALVLRVSNPSLELAKVYCVKENCLTIRQDSHKFYLPTTGSEFAEIDFIEEINQLHN